MKIVYVPIVIPVNYRTILSLIGGLVALLLMIFATQSNQWKGYNLSSGSSGAVSTASPTAIGDPTLSPQQQQPSLAQIHVDQGLRSINIKICSPEWSPRVKAPAYLCEMRHVIYSECDTLSDSWCQGGQPLSAAFRAAVAGTVLLGLTLTVGFLREMLLGIFLSIVFGLQVLVLALYHQGEKISMNGGVIPYLERSAVKTGGVWWHYPSDGYYCFLAAMTVVACCAALSLSLWCCAAHGDENQARHPPSVTVVEMEARGSSSVGGGGGEVELAQTAPEPGFVRLGSGDVEDDDDGRELIAAVEASHRQQREEDPAASSRCEATDMYDDQQ
jgi:hypothetical protein